MDPVSKFLREVRTIKMSFSKYNYKVCVARDATVKERKQSLFESDPDGIICIATLVFGQDTNEVERSNSLKFSLDRIAHLQGINKVAHLLRGDLIASTRQLFQRFVRLLVALTTQNSLDS